MSSHTSGNVAGRARGRGGRGRPGRVQRRGTVLLMVVGVLALMSIVAVVYVTIGQADRRGAAALVREQRLDDQSKAIADYITTIIGDDVTAVQTVIDPTGATLTVREAWDGASFDNNTRTTPTTPQIRFDPVGQGTDPWLADPEPTWLRYVRADPARDTSGVRRYLNAMDWGQISNISPDGRFVNLGNLRNNFLAEPGRGKDADGRPRTTWGLTLNQRAPGAGAYRVGTPANQTPVRRDNGTTIAVTMTPVAQVYNDPSEWSTRLVNAFRPIKEVDTRGNAPGAGQLPIAAQTIGAPEFLSNQWADCDGDGMADSKWTDLVDTTNPLTPRPVLNADGQIRWVVAARIIDLSGLVNVNTAGDLCAPLPGNGTGNDLYPLGLTPGDVDLRSLLTMRTLFDMYGNDDVYSLYEQPLLNPAPPSDYSDGFDGTPYDATSARDAGFAGYTALRRALNTGQVARGAIDVTSGGDVIGRDDKYKFFERLSAPEGTRRVGVGYESMFQFGIADQAELLTYWGTNDPSVTSALETTVDNRWDNGSVGSPQSRLGPLRSNRPLSVERGGVGNFYPLPQTGPARIVNNGAPDDDALLKAATDVRHLLTTVSGSRPIISTPVSGPGVPITSNEVAADVYDLLERGDVPRIFMAYAQALLPWSSVATTGTNGQDPWAVEGTDRTTSKSDQIRTLSYGHRGPELPLWMSAFMAVNLKDAYDTDNTPTSYTLLADVSFTDGTQTLWPTARFSSSAGRFPTQIEDTPSGATSSPFWPWMDGHRLNLSDPALTGDPARLMHTDVKHPAIDSPMLNRRPFAPAINVFGLEAQPFLTQVALISCFTDAPFGVGNADNEGVLWTDTFLPNGLRDPIEVTRTSIKGEVTDGNSDFVFQVIAFQVHNPFEYTVDLNPGTGSSYSLQFGGSRFEFQSTVTLGPKATKIFYCITPGRATAKGRMQACWTGPAAGPDILDTWLMYQFGFTDTTELTQCALRRYAVATVSGSPEVGDTAVLNLLDSTIDNNRVALLWRQETGFGSTRHILVDRMRDPELTGIPSLVRSFNLPDIDSQPPMVGGGTDPDDIEGTDASDGGADNTGFSLMTFGSFRRPDDPGAASGGIPLGAIPAFCVERRGFAPGLGSRPLNVGPTDDASLRDRFANLGLTATMNRTDFIGSFGVPTPGKMTLSDLITPQTTTDSLLPSIKQNPQTRGGRRIDANLASVPFQNHYVEAFLPNNRFRLPSSEVRTLRPTDLLLPWALGSWELPGVSGLDYWASERRNGTPTTPLEWATVSEMLSMALDYEPTATAQRDLFGFDTENWRAGEQAYDRGCLRIDRFVPFLDSNNDQTYSFKSGSGTPTPEDLAPPGIPLATAVVDRLRTREVGSLTRSVPGLINVNTAPLGVLRALPALSPPNVALNVAPAVWFWPGVQGSQSDIGTTLLAYRDNSGLWPRDVDADGVFGSAITFRTDAGSPSGNINGFGRRLKTGVQGLRQPYTPWSRYENGLRSIGEAMIVRDLSIAGTPGVGAYPYSIDRIARDGLNMGGTPANPVYIADSTSYNSGGTKRPNQIIDDYQEQFALSGALMNSISVRSDVFACWFIMRGYTAGDVEGLESPAPLPPNQEPMVPSVERRFLMIIDRSNVTQRGQQPRVLMFKELPM